MGGRGGNQHDHPWTKSLEQECLCWSKPELKGDTYSIWRKGPRIGKCEKDIGFPSGDQ